MPSKRRPPSPAPVKVYTAVMMVFAGRRADKMLDSIAREILDHTIHAVSAAELQERLRYRLVWHEQPICTAGYVRTAGTALWRWRDPPRGDADANAKELERLALRAHAAGVQTFLRKTSYVPRGPRGAEDAEGAGAWCRLGGEEQLLFVTTMLACSGEAALAPRELDYAAQACELLIQAPRRPLPPAPRRRRRPHREAREEGRAAAAGVVEGDLADRPLNALTIWDALDEHRSTHVVARTRPLP
eukprot:tig00021493_g21882.t1